MVFCPGILYPKDVMLKSKVVGEQNVYEDEIEQTRLKTAVSSEKMKMIRELQI